MSPPAKRLLENMRLVAPRHIYVRRREEKAALELVRHGLAVWYGVHELGLTFDGATKYCGHNERKQQ